MVLMRKSSSFLITIFFLALIGPWINQTDGSKWYRLAGSQTDWQKYQ